MSFALRNPSVNTSKVFLVGDVAEFCVEGTQRKLISFFVCEEVDDQCRVLTAVDCQMKADSVEADIAQAALTGIRGEPTTSTNVARAFHQFFRDQCVVENDPRICAIPKGNVYR